MTTTLPPGPKVPKLAQTLFMARYWDRWLHACHRRYGDVFTVRFAPWGDIVYFADPAAIKEIFTTPPATAHAGEAHAVLAPVLGERSVLVTDEAEHLRRRKLMLPLFHGDAVRQYAELIESLTEDELDRWPVGQSFALHPRVRELTFEVILRAVFGITDDARMGEMRALLPGLVEIDDVLLLMWLRPELGRVGPWKRWGELKGGEDGLVMDEKRRRRTAPPPGGRNDGPSRLLPAGMDAGSERGARPVTRLLAAPGT